MTAQMTVLLKILLILNIHSTLQCPSGDTEAKAAYKFGDIADQTPITLDKIKTKLRETGIFDEKTTQLTDMERKELKKLFDTIEIMTTSRNRQPPTTQNLASCLRMLERVVKKQLKEGQISETLAAKFNWEKLSGRPKREKPLYYLDKATNMRMFTTD